VVRGRQAHSVLPDATDNSNDNRKTLWLMRADGTDAVQVAGPVYIDPGALGVDDSWFGYYGYIDWRCAFDWFRG